MDGFNNSRQSDNGDISDNILTNEAIDPNAVMNFSKKIESIVISKPPNGYSAERVEEPVA